MRPEDFDTISTLLKSRSGLALTPDKVYLLDSRLLPIARSHGMKDIVELIGKIRTNPDPALVNEIVEAMTTNESSFFRDGKPYDQLRQKVFPKLREIMGARKQLRVWSAAASSGQEAYSIAMCLQEEGAKFPGWSFEIVGTDLSTKILEKAQRAVYTQFEVQRGLPIQLLVKYFTQQEENCWKVNDVLRSMVSYKVQNLLEDFSPLGKFDIIFCRNVLIYFDEPTKKAVLERLYNSLHPHGVLYLGSTETIFGITSAFVPFEQERGIYVPAPR